MLKSAKKNFDKTVARQSQVIPHPPKKTQLQKKGLKEWSISELTFLEPEFSTSSAKYITTEQLLATYSECVSKRKKDAIHMYDSALSEKQIDKQWKCLNSESGKKFMMLYDSLSAQKTEEDSINLTHLFSKGRMEKIDTLLEYVKMVNSNPEGLLKLKQSVLATAVDSINLKMLIDAQEAKALALQNTPEYLEKVKMRHARIEALYDENFNDKDLDYLIAYFKWSELKKIKALEFDINLQIRQKVNSDFLAKMKEIRMKKNTND